MKKHCCFVLLLLLSAISTVAFALPLKSSIGIGIQFQMDSSRGYKIPLVIRIMPDAPAEAAGVKEGDFLISANNTSLKELTLDEVAKYIAGDEGTSVKLEVERGGKAITFNITRKKYEYANSYYTSDKKGDEFCDALLKLMNDAPYGFKRTKGAIIRIDSSNYFHTSYYHSYVSVPGAVRTEFTYLLLSTTAYVLLAKGSSLEEVGRKSEEYAKKLQSCFPDYYFEKEKNDKTGLPYLSVGKKYNNGFETPIITMSIYKNSDDTYEAAINISSGDKTRIYQVQKPAKQDDFSAAVRKIADDVPKKFENVKGVKHESKGFFGSVWYEPAQVPQGLSCSIGKGLFSNGCDCLGYEGSSFDDADKVFTDVSTKLRDALGSEYYYNSEKPELSLSIPSSVLAIYNFAKKKGKRYESCPVISVYLDKKDDGKYYVKVLFNESGM